MSSTILTVALIERHERLYPRLAALLQQVERLALRRGRQAVPADTVQLAAGLCRRAAPLLGPEGREIVGALRAATGPRTVPVDHARLALLLGQAVAGLEAFEAAHWVPVEGVPSWQLGNGESRPVSRLRPKPPAAAQRQPAPKPRGAGPGHRETPGQMREVLLKRILERENERYMQGYRDARAGKPPIRPITEIDAVPHGGGYTPYGRGGEGPPPPPPDD